MAAAARHTIQTIQQSIESNPSENEEQIQQLQRSLDGNAAQSVLNDTPVELLVSVIRKLYVNQHSLGILYLLASQVKSIPQAIESPTIMTLNENLEIANEFFHQTSGFLLGFRPSQVKTAIKQFAKVCRAYVNVSIQLNLSHQAIWPLKRSLQKLSSNCLTPIHACFILACLQAKKYYAAKYLLDVSMIQVDTKANAMECADILKYYYYGGMVLIGLKDFRAAYEFFYLAITIPSRSLSAITIAAFKKYILVCSILDYKPMELPKLMSSLVQRHLKTYCKAYLELVRALEGKDSIAIEKCMTLYQPEFVKASNLGLVKQAIEALQRRKIQRLTNTFVTLSCHDIALMVGLENATHAERYILKMVQRGDIHATIDKRNNMVTFTDDREHFDNTAMLTQLHAQISKIKQFSYNLQLADAEISCDPRFLLKKFAQRRPSSSALKWQDHME